MTRALAEPAARKSPRRTALAAEGTLSHSIYAAMLQRLQKGQIGPHDRVLDHELAQQFQCTRMPARLASLSSFAGLPDAAATADANVPRRAV